MCVCERLCTSVLVYLRARALQRCLRLRVPRSIIAHLAALPSAAAVPATSFGDLTVPEFQAAAGANECCYWHSNYVSNAFVALRDPEIVSAANAIAHARNRALASEAVVVMGRQLYVNEDSVEVSNGRVRFREPGSVELPSVNFAACQNSTLPAGYIDTEQQPVASYRLPDIRYRECDGGYVVSVDAFCNNWKVRERRFTVPTVAVHDQPCSGYGPYDFSFTKPELSCDECGKPKYFAGVDYDYYGYGRPTRLCRCADSERRAFLGTLFSIHRSLPSHVAVPRLWRAMAVFDGRRRLVSAVGGAVLRFLADRSAAGDDDDEDEDGGSGDDSDAD